MTQKQYTKEAKYLGLHIEEEFGYAQAVKVNDTIYLSGQVSLDNEGNVVGIGDMETQVRQAYTNIKKLLAQYNASIENVVDEVIFITDMEAVSTAEVIKCRREMYSGNPVVASTVIEISRLGFPELMVEIKCVAKI
ncbi:putative translation initiation inhibitor, yjgF family [Rivularia sp. PCC 7116]|uniref:RidA family protein n=1 Tax=Rivularia sp. PCC 7116 TaxID=373994 RepID=UPI00029EEB4C|nr:RidA family protein [Rivularia sp. PCC 7116]AFY53325.1 putative translation initiation inhibitor, yjgF family [Rivularia sp. PCC 7116]